MKARERHELATNELADAAARFMEKARPYASYILIGAAVLVAAIWWTVYQSGSSQARENEAILDLPEVLQAGGEYRAGEPALANIEAKIAAADGYLTRYPDSPALATVRFTLANELYKRALLTWAAGGDRSKVDNDLTRGSAIYQELSRRPDRLGAWSQYGLACVTDMLGERERAKEMLMAVARNHPDSAVEISANERLAAITHAQPLKFAEPKPEAKPNVKPDGGQSSAEGKTEAVQPEAKQGGAVTVLPHGETAPPPASPGEAGQTGGQNPSDATKDAGTAEMLAPKGKKD